MRQRWWIAGAVATAFLVALALVQCSTGDMPSGATVSRARYIAAEGKVEARPGLQSEFGSALSATVRRYLVKQGDRVELGQLLVVLADEDLSAALQQTQAEFAVAQAKLNEVQTGARHQEIEQARAAVKRALAEFELAGKERVRARELFKENTVARATFDQTENAYAVAAAQVQEAREYLELLEIGPKPETIAWHQAQVAAAQARVVYQRALLDKTRITSPINGVLIERYLDEGEVVMPEKPLGIVADIDNLRINAEVDETDAGRLRVGDAVEVSSYAYPGKLFRGRVEEIADYVGKRELKPNSPAVNLGLKIIQVKIAFLEATPLKLGMTVDVRIAAAP